MWLDIQQLAIDGPGLAPPMSLSAEQRRTLTFLTTAASTARRNRSWQRTASPAL
jgi:hypothetical protein